MNEKNILLEIGTEEMPAKSLLAALEQLKQILETNLTQARIKHGKIETLATPRRLTVIVENTSPQQEPINIEEKGPALEAAFNEDGTPTKAALGFARNKGVKIEELVSKEFKGKKFLFLERLDKGIPSKDLLPSILPNIISQLYFPKTMRWGDGNNRFVRPVHWLVALWGDEVIPFELFGIPSGNISQGHRFWGSKNIFIENQKYKASLRENFVIVDHLERKDIIIDYLNKNAKKVAGFPVIDEDLLWEVTFLVEYPNAVMGNFAEKYLTLPDEVLITVMKKHQRYFPIKNNNGLLPAFVSIYSGSPANDDLICRGNEKILEGRFEDALFFFNEDTKLSLAQHAQKLKTITFLEGLGNMEDKAKRLMALVKSIGLKLTWQESLLNNAIESAYLAKADLTTLMVNELPELQGIIGKHYGAREGLDQEISLALADHYKPRFADDDLPDSLLSQVLSLVDKLDNIAAAFFTGNIPSGSQDPLALRRQGLAIVKILLQMEEDFSVNWLFDILTSAYADQGYDLTRICNEFMDFIANRFKRYLIDNNFSHDMVDALLSEGCQEYKKGVAKISSLLTLRDNEAFKSLIQSYVRTTNILKNISCEITINEDLWQEDCEKILYKETLKCKKEAEQWEQKNDYLNMFKTLAKLALPLDEFFNTVLVMAKEEDIRENRLALLQLIKNTLNRGVDLSHIVIN